MEAVTKRSFGGVAALGAATITFGVALGFPPLPFSFAIGFPSLVIVLPARPSPPDSWGVGDSVLYGCRVLIGE